MDREHLYDAMAADPRATADIIAALLARGGAPAEAARLPGVYEALEVVEGAPAVLDSVRRLQLDARNQVRVIDIPPYIGHTDYYTEQELLQIDRMAAGVAYRVIYSGEAYDNPTSAPNMLRMVAEGETARVMADPPMKLVVGDDDLIVMSLGVHDRGDQIALLVRPSRLFTNLTSMFETLWCLAVPVTTEGVGSHVDERDGMILMLMASGATDDAIARRLGLGRRTVVRRVSALMASLGASNRFQAGVQAARRGWL